MAERFIIRVGSGLYRDKPSDRWPEGKPYHRPVYLIWDTKPAKRKPRGDMVCLEEDKVVAEKKCKRLNDQENFE